MSVQFQSYFKVKIEKKDRKAGTLLGILFGGKVYIIHHRTSFGVVHIGVRT